jgi:putative ABC transport system ATP-binding protein
MTPATPSQPLSRLELRSVVVSEEAPLDLTLGAGEMVAVAGWNSSVLLWTIAGLRPCVTGAVLVDGRPIKDHAEALAAGVAMISSASPLASLLTAFENVLLPLAEEQKAAAPTPGAKRAQVDEDPVAASRRALEAVGLLESANHLIEDLSGGQQQRVAIARAIAGRPRVLLADQATSDLDAGNRTRVLELLRELAATGTAVVLASDDPSILAVADRTVVLDRDRAG